MSKTDTKYRNLEAEGFTKVVDYPSDSNGPGYQLFARVSEAPVVHRLKEFELYTVFPNVKYPYPRRVLTLHLAPEALAALGKLLQ